MNTKPKTKIKIPVLSRLTQKTFIAVIALYFLSSLVMQGQYYLSLSQISDKSQFSFDALLFPLIPTIAPLLIFLVVYAISTEKVTRLWRVSKALIITFMAMIFGAFAAMINVYVFSSSLGYNNTPPASYSYLIELIPIVLALVVAVVLSVMQSKSKDRNTSDASASLQKLFLVFVILFGLGQPLLSLVPYGSSQPAMDQGVLIGLIMSVVIPIVVIGVLYILTSRQRTVRERSFIAIFYVTFGALLSIALSTLPYAFINPTATNYTENSLMTYLPIVVTLVGFAAIVAWHKMKKVL